MFKQNVWSWKAAPGKLIPFPLGIQSAMCNSKILGGSEVQPKDTHFPTYNTNILITIKVKFRFYIFKTVY